MTGSQAHILLYSPTKPDIHVSSVGGRKPERMNASPQFVDHKWRRVAFLVLSVEKVLIHLENRLRLTINHGNFKEPSLAMQLPGGELGMRGD